VDGCAAKSEPGYEHFEWLRIQLGILRDRGMKALLIGHVPPARVDSKMSWDETCWQKYTLWQKQYRDVIIGSFFGHMNIDHFILQDFKEIKKGFKKGRAPAKMHGPTAKYAADEELSVMSATDYLIDLRDYFSKIPSISGKLQTADEDEQETSWLDGFMSLLKKNKKNKGKKGKKKHSKKPQNPLRKIGGEYGERYGLSFVQASIVPNFFPTLRVFEYNITGLEGLDVASSPSPGLSDSKKTLGAYPKQSPILSSEMKPLFMDEFTEDIALPSLKASNPVDDQKKKKKKKKKYKFKVPKAPSKATPPGPAYSPQTLSLLGYTQYFANITHINNDFLNTAEEEGVGEEKWKEGKHKGKSKKGKPHPKKFKFEVEYDTFSDKIFGLKDLTVRSYIDLAAVIGESQSALQSAYEVEDIEQASEAEDGASASKKGKKKKNKKKPKESKSSKVWHTFIKRAFVGTIDPEELEKRFLAWNASPSQAGNASEGGSLEL
jgi:endopolyphosphatase